MKKKDIYDTKNSLKWGMKKGAITSVIICALAMLAQDEINQETFVALFISLFMVAAGVGLILTLIKMIIAGIKNKKTKKTEDNPTLTIKGKFDSEFFANWYGMTFVIALLLGCFGCYGDTPMATVFWWWLGISTALFIPMSQPTMHKFILEVKTEKSTDDDFDLQGFGSLIWKSEEGVPINFTYTDASKKKTKRRVIMHEMTKDSKTRFYFEGYCQLRKASRTFNSENMQDLHDDNGEIIEIEDFINKLAGYKAFGTKEVRTIEE